MSRSGNKWVEAYAQLELQEQKTDVKNIILGLEEKGNIRINGGQTVPQHGSCRAPMNRLLSEQKGERGTH